MISQVIKALLVFLPPSATENSTSPKRLLAVEKVGKPSHLPEIDGPSQASSNPNLDSFEAVMKALDEVLDQKVAKSPAAKTPQPTVKPSVKGDKGKQKVSIEEEMAIEADNDSNDSDVETAMDAELKRLLEGEDPHSEEALDYNLIKNFLESFKSQGGLSGPVSNLTGRLAPDLKFPRDSS
jgi:hypothetical protein